MIVKFNKYEKLYESLPRQSTIDQLKKIRNEIKRIQKGDIGDKITKDLAKRKNMNNMIWWDNPLDRHIDSYEKFVKIDSKKSLGYSKKGD